MEGEGGEGLAQQHRRPAGWHSRTLFLRIHFLSPSTHIQPRPSFPSLHSSPPSNPTQLATDPSWSACDFGFGFDMQTMTLKNSTKAGHNKTDKADKFADDNEVTIRSAKIFPNTWSPKVKANITEIDNDFQLASFVLPEDEVTLDKEYKITYKLRIGKGFPSGLLRIPVAFDAPGAGLDEPVIVLVK